MHYTRKLTHGDTSVNRYENRGKQKLELPDGTIITESEKIKNINIIIERIKNRRLLGYQNFEDTLDIIEKVLDDYHGTYKGGKIKRGKKTILYNRYLDTLANSNQGFEQGLITIEQAEWISKIVSELCKTKEPVRLLKMCMDLVLYKNIEWLINAFTKLPIIGITYNSKGETIEFSKDISEIYKELEKIKEQNKRSLTDEDKINAELHSKRIDSYNDYRKFKIDQSPYWEVVSVAVKRVIEYLVKNGETEENNIYEKCETNSIILQQMIESDIGITKDGGIVKFTIIPKIQELIKKKKQMQDNIPSGEGLSYKERLSYLNINYVEDVALRTLEQ